MTEKMKVPPTPKPSKGMKYYRKQSNSRIDYIIYILYGIIMLSALIFILCFCSGCSYPISSLEEDEYITIYDKEWNVKYYGKIRKE